MSAADVRVERISFRNTLDLVVRQHDRLVAPQWTRGGPSLPAAFPRLATKVGLTAELASGVPRGAGALRNRRAGGTLSSVGALAETPLDFAGGTMATIALDVPVLNPRVDVGTVAWAWEYRDGGTWHDAGTSEHEIAMTLGPPTAPWTGMHPWWEVVRHACQGARGAANVADAASKMAHHTFHAFGGSAYHWDGSTNYATNGREKPRAFDCATFLRLLAGEHLPDEVDCSDLAAVLSTFANILGCSLDQIAIGQPLELNPVLLANHREWGNRLDRFGIHEFAVTGAAAPKLKVWDGCLQVSSAGAPASPGTTAPVPADVPAGMPLPTYLKRLLFRNNIPFNERELIREVRPIGPMPAEVMAVVPPEEAVAAAPGRPAEPPRVPHLELRDLDIGPWTLIAPTVVPDLEPPAGDREKVMRLLWRSDGDLIVACTVYLCLTPRAARLRTQAILGNFTGRAVTHQVELGPTEGVPDVRFELGDGAIVVGTLLNVAYVVKGARGQKDVAEIRRIADAVRVKIIGFGRLLS